MTTVAFKETKQLEEKIGKRNRHRKVRGDDLNTKYCFRNIVHCDVICDKTVLAKLDNESNMGILHIIQQDCIHVSISH